MATAQDIAQVLVSEHLAACVNVLPGVQSIYRWQGEVTRDSEVLLLIKTVSDRMPALTSRLQTMHPNELPEVLAVEVAGGLPAYLDWVAEQTCTGETNR